MIGFHFSRFDPNEQGKTKFDQLLDVFLQLLSYTNGDVGEALAMDEPAWAGNIS